jgi:hypothetical protein
VAHPMDDGWTYSLLAIAHALGGSVHHILGGTADVRTLS